MIELGAVFCSSLVKHCIYFMTVNTNMQNGIMPKNNTACDTGKDGREEQDNQDFRTTDV